VGRLDDAVAVVTGGARGIGRAVVRAFAAEGASVVSVDRDESAGDRAAQEIAAGTDVIEAGGRVAFEAGDVADRARMKEVVDAVAVRHGGRLDILVNNAAVQREARLLEQTDEDFRAMLDTNLFGPFLVTQVALPHMLRGGRGVVINLSSILGLVGDPVLPVYAATKAAILGFTRSVAIAYADRGLRVVAICPGDVDTELNQQYFATQPDPLAFRRRVEQEYPVRRIATPEEIARVAVFLATDDASFITGSHIVVDGGLLSRVYEL
jgi:NAD(P)-dependent dehydrogenase (short-subunit alcohol dehydrogenase family)